MVEAGEIVCTPAVVPWVLLASRFAGESHPLRIPRNGNVSGFSFSSEVSKSKFSVYTKRHG